MKWVLGVAAVAVMVAGCGEDDGSEGPEPTPAANGITLNTSTWSPDDENAHWMQAGIGGSVRVDANGCVYWGGDRPEWGQNVVWPAGYTASRATDGTVTIFNPDGVIVAKTGHRLRVGGGHPLHAPSLACSAEGATEGTVMITDVLPPLDD
jgi:hypothetical protein